MKRKLSITKIISFVLIISLLISSAGFCENIHAGGDDEFLQKIKVKKTGWYDLYNPSKSMDVSFYIYKKKKASFPLSRVEIKKGKKERIYLNKGSYYLMHFKLHPGETSYLISHFDEKVKLKFISSQCILKPNKKLVVQGDTRKSFYVKFKVPRTGVIHLNEQQIKSVVLYDAKKNKIASDVYLDGLPYGFGVQQGKTYYFKLKYEGDDYFQYYYQKLEQGTQTIGSYSSTKESAVSINSFLRNVEYYGLIGLNGKPETHWYVYDMDSSDYALRVSLAAEGTLCWLKKDGFQIEFFDQNGSLILSDKEDAFIYTDMEDTHISRVYIKVTVQQNCTSQYKICLN